MRKTIYKLCRAGLVWLVPAALISCQHKELCYDHSHVVEVKVNFDWSECPDAAPRTIGAAIVHSRRQPLQPL